MAIDLTVPNALSLTGGVVDYTNPDWYNTYMQNVASVGNTMAGDATTKGSIAYNTNNWNIDPATGKPAQLTGDFNANLTAANAAASGANAPGGYLQQADTQIKTASTYDPTKFSTFMNPYTQTAAKATTDLSNKNLFESVLPNLNSTFTGAGQFGSTRNADFENRAIRDQQNMLTNALGTLNYNAVTNAQKDYSDWANKGMTAGLNSATLGNQNIENLRSTGKTYLDWQNAGLSANYQDFLKQIEYPGKELPALASLTTSLKGSIQPSQTLTPGEMTQIQKAMALSGLLGKVGDASSGTLEDIQALWDSIFPKP